MLKFKRLMFSLFACFGLFLCFNHLSTPTVKAEVSYNTDVAKAWELSDKYLQTFYKRMGYKGQSSNPYKAMTNSESNEHIQYLGTTYSKQLNSALLFRLGHVYPSDINSKLTIHANDWNFIVEESSGNDTIDLLILNYVNALGSVGRINEFKKMTGQTIQPTWKVEGNKIDFYIPCVYYRKEIRQEVAQSLETKLKLLTGKEYDVKFRTSKPENVKKYFGVDEDEVSYIGNLFDKNEIYEFDDTLKIKYIDGGRNNDCAFIRLDCNFQQFVKQIDKMIYYVDLGNTGSNQRYDMATFLEAWFMQPFSDKIYIWCDDYIMSMNEIGKVIINYAK